MTQATRPSPVQRIQALATQFHSLGDHPAVLAWDPERLDEWAATVASSGERHAARFVLHVWNHWAEWKCGRFDVIEAMNTWDARNRAVFARWAANPFVL